MRVSLARRVGLLLLFGIGYVVAMRVSFAFPVSLDGVSAMWLPAGLLLGVLLRRQKSEWPAILATALIAGLAGAMPVRDPRTTLLYTGADLAEAYISALVIRHFVGEHPRLERLHEVFALALVPSLFGEPISATIVASVQQFLFQSHDFWHTWTLWWSANTLGEIVGVPLVLTAPARWSRPQGRDARRALELTLLTLIVIAVTAVAFTRPLSLRSGPPLGWIAFPLIALAAVRFGPVGAAVPAAAYGMIAVWTTMHGRGPFALLAADAGDRALWLNLLLGFTVFASLMLAAADSEYRRAMIAVRESGAKYRSIFENALDAIFRTTVDGRYADANPATARMLGYESPEQLMAEVTDVTQLYADADQRRGIMDRLRADGQIPAVDVAVRRRDGSIGWLSMSLQVVRDNRGEIHYVEGVAEDITERRDAAAEAEYLQRQLFQAQKMESLGTLAGGIAHDFNNILAVIVGMADLAVLALPDDHRARRHVKDILRAAERAGELVDRVLTFSQQQSEERRLEHLVPIAAEVARLMRAALPSSVEIETRFAPDLPSVLANATQVRQVLVNLMTNAGQAMREGGGHLSLTLEVVDVDEQLRHEVPKLRDGRYVRVRVSDTGHGMDARTMDRIFEPFFTTKPTGEGTGLGLSVVHGIVEYHEGAVTVRSRVGVGTTFDVYLPAQQGEAEPEPVVVPAQPKGRAERVLFVDDEPMLARVGELYLTELGYQARGFDSPFDALAAFRATPNAFDVVITDLTMPEGSGLELADELRLIRPDIPIILATGFRGSLKDDVLRAHGIRATLAKPYAGARLAAVLREVLGESGHGTT